MAPNATFTQNSVRVNCLLNLTGKLASPNIHFDLELPTVNDEERELVRSYISTDEQMEMQIIYLLGIGRFYTYDYANTNMDSGSGQSSAMNSLLSSTLSGQLNNMLSHIINSNQWNFGTNLSTGDNGWTDMEVEGMLSGRLLNNRLLINGNFGYRDNQLANTNFIGDFDVQWLLTPSGDLSLKGYNQTNDRYFTKSTLTTQGIGIMYKKDFMNWKELVDWFLRRRKKPQQPAERKRRPENTFRRKPFLPQEKKENQTKNNYTRIWKKTYYLPAEWHKQSYIQLTWPHADTDWAYMLDEVETCFVRLATEIASRQPLLLVAPEFPATLADFPYRDQITFVKCPTNDTWARDHAFITLLEKHSDPQLLDFCFNGWGMKFAAHKDNLINSHLFKTGVLNGDYINCRNFVLEGGSIESDGEGTLLTTSPCLLAPNRNDTLSRKDIEAYLMERFNLRQVLWLDYGYLTGDDTDSHVDTLARLCPDHTITYVQCLDKNDEHYGALRSMEDQLKTFRTLDGDPYRLLPLPMPEAIYDEDGERLPATYANFLIMNEAVLYPTYAQPENDARAAQVLAEAFPGREIVGVDCRALIKQHGSLHCVTMQYPESVKNQIAQ